MWNNFSLSLSLSLCKLAPRSCTSAFHEIQRAVPAICSYRHPVVLGMEMGGDTHSFRSITYMDDVRVLLRHRRNLVNMRTLRVPRGEEGKRVRGCVGGWWQRVGGGWGVLWGSRSRRKRKKVPWRISHLGPPVVGILNRLPIRRMDFCVWWLVIHCLLWTGWETHRGIIPGSKQVFAIPVLSLGADKRNNN